MLRERLANKTTGRPECVPHPTGIGSVRVKSAGMVGMLVTLAGQLFCTFRCWAAFVAERLVLQCDWSYESARMRLAFEQIAYLCARIAPLRFAINAPNFFQHSVSFTWLFSSTLPAFAFAFCFRYFNRKVMVNMTDKRSAIFGAAFQLVAYIVSEWVVLMNSVRLATVVVCHRVFLIATLTLFFVSGMIGYVPIALYVGIHAPAFFIFWVTFHWMVDFLTCTSVGGGALVVWIVYCVKRRLEDCEREKYRVTAALDAERHYLETMQSTLRAMLASLFDASCICKGDGDLTSSTPQLEQMLIGCGNPSTISNLCDYSASAQESHRLLEFLQNASKGAIRQAEIVHTSLCSAPPKLGDGESCADLDSNILEVTLYGIALPCRDPGANAGLFVGMQLHAASAGSTVKCELLSSDVSQAPHVREDVQESNTVIESGMAMLESQSGLMMSARAPDPSLSYSGTGRDLDNETMQQQSDLSDHDSDISDLKGMKSVKSLGTLSWSISSCGHHRQANHKQDNARICSVNAVCDASTQTQPRAVCCQGAQTEPVRTAEAEVLGELQAAAENDAPVQDGGMMPTGFAPGPLCSAKPPRLPLRVQVQSGSGSRTCARIASKESSTSGSQERQLQGPLREDRTFTIELGRTAATMLGVDVKLEGACLRIIAVQEIGLCPKWNKENPDKEVMVHDSIISVNGTTGSGQAMISVMKMDNVLEIVIQREAALAQEELPGGSEASAGLASSFTVMPVRHRLASIAWFVKHWNVGRRRDMCCPWHAVLHELRKSVKRVHGIKRCNPVWSPFLGWQCQQCMSLNRDIHDHRAVCHLARPDDSIHNAAQEADNPACGSIEGNPVGCATGVVADCSSSSSNLTFVSSTEGSIASADKPAVQFKAVDFTVIDCSSSFVELCGPCPPGLCLRPWLEHGNTAFWTSYIPAVNRATISNQPIQPLLHGRVILRPPHCVSAGIKLQVDYTVTLQDPDIDDDFHMEKVAKMVFTRIRRQCDA